MISRRELLSGMGCCAASLALGLSADAVPKSKCLPTISGALWWLDPDKTAAWGESGWRDELDCQRRIGFDLLWLVNAPAGLDHPSDPLKTVLDLCAKRKVQVILDTGTAPGIWFDNFDPPRELNACGRSVRRIAERFAGHPAFHAWYIPHEIYMTWDNTAQFEVLYGGLTDLCKKASDLPVMLSPFFILDRTRVFGDFRYNEPDEYQAYWTKMVRKTGIDVIMMQDSGEHFSYVTDEQRRPFYRAMHAACRESGARFWGNVETAEYECPSIEEYVKRYGRVHHSAAKGLPWRPVPIERLRTKLELAAEYSERIVTWGYREFCRPALGSAAAEWYGDYRRYASGVRR